MKANLPYLYEGEVLDIINQDGNSTAPFIRYICRVELGNGSDAIFKNVESTTLFGGIADYFQIRQRVSKDSGNALKVVNRNSENARIGDRVLISFVGGNIQRPMIVGWLQHPNQIVEFDGSKAKDLKPQALLQYLGTRFVWGDKGQFTVIHKGAPEIKEVEGGGAVGEALSAISGLLGESPSNPALGGENPAVTPAPIEEVTLLEFLEKGIFRVRDSDGQMIELDRVKGRIYISNNDLKSTEDPEAGPASGGNLMAINATDAEYVLLEKRRKLVLINARGIAQIYTNNLRKDVTEGDHSHKVGGNSKWLIGGDESITISGSKTDNISGDLGLNIGGAIDIKVVDAVSIKTGKTAMLELSTGVKLGNAAGDLLKQISEGLDKASQVATQAASIVVPTAVGPSGPPTNAAQFTQFALDLTKLKLLVDQIMG